MGKRSPSVLAVLAVLVGLASPPALPAQSIVAAGRVLLPKGADSVPVPGARVLLHRVGREVQGPVDSATADGAGRFRFRFRPDTAALYLVSAAYGGIEYFSPPVHTNPERPDTAMRVLVYDTSSSAPVTVEARHIVVPRPAADGTRSVLDLIVLRNDGALARVAPDSAHPSWSLVLPRGAGPMQLGESDLSPDAVVREGNTVKVLAPIAPGQKQLSLEYPVAPVGGTLQFAVGAGGAPLNLLVEERDAKVSGGTLALADSQVIEGRSFRRWTGRVPAGGTVTLALSARSVALRWVLPALVGGVGLAFVLAAWRLRRRPAPSQARATPDRLLDAIAALDARYAERATDIPPEVRGRYQAERARLKAELEAALAARKSSSYT